MKPFTLNTPKKEKEPLPGMKKKIKALKGKIVCLRWSYNGWDHKVTGKINKLWKSRFDFLINGSTVVKINYDNVNACDEV